MMFRVLVLSLMDVVAFVYFMCFEGTTADGFSWAALGVVVMIVMVLNALTQ